MNFIILRMADPTSMEAPFRRGILTGARHWEGRRKAHRRTWDLPGTGVGPGVAGFALFKVAVRNTWHRVVTLLQGLRGRNLASPPRHRMVRTITRDRASITVVAISLMNFIVLRLACPTTTMEGILIGVCLWEVGRKAHRRTWDLLGAKVVPGVVGFALSKVAVWNIWHRVVTVLQGSRGRSPPRPSRGMVGAISRSSTYGGLIFEDVLSSIRLCITGWRRPLGKNRRHRAGDSWM